MIACYMLLLVAQFCFYFIQTEEHIMWADFNTSTDMCTAPNLHNVTCRLCQQNTVDNRQPQSACRCRLIFSNMMLMLSLLLLLLLLLLVLLLLVLVLVLLCESS